MGHRSIVTLVLLALPFATACSSSDDSSGSPSTGDAGATSDSAVSGDAAPAVDGAAPGDSSGFVDSAPPTTDAASDSAVPSGPYFCAYSTSGGRTDPTTNAPSACANGKVEQPSGAGDYTASFGGGFQTAANEIVTLACTISSATPPSAGATWALLKDDHAQGNCQLTVIAGSTATSWIASSNAASITGAASIAFQSAAIAHGTAHPSDVYYTYDVVLDGTLKSQTAGGADVTVHGRFVQTQLPLGN